MYLEYIIYIVGSILILPAILFAMWAQFRVMGTFRRYSEIPAQDGISAAALARRMLDQNGCSHVTVERTRGTLSDHYDSRKKAVRLSDTVHDSCSLAALGVAAHEVGHAIQDHTGYFPLRLRQIVVKSTSLINKILMPLIIIGLIGSLFAGGLMILGMDGDTFFLYLMLAFCVMYGLSFVVNLITLPTEYNASNRAKALLNQGNYLMGDEERGAVARVLNAAALTYVAALVVSLAFFLRFLGLVLMSRRR